MAQPTKTLTLKNGGKTLRLTAPAGPSFVPPGASGYQYALAKKNLAMNSSPRTNALNQAKLT